MSVNDLFHLEEKTALVTDGARGLGEIGSRSGLCTNETTWQTGRIGGLAVYLASDASSFVTESTFVIDGGYTIW